MDEIGRQLLDIASGGWLSLVLVVLLGGIYIYFTIKEKNERNARAAKETDETRVKDQADTVPVNQRAEDARDQAQDEIDRIRAEIEGSKSDDSD